MRWENVRSTSIAAIGYDYRKRVLGIEFLHSGAVYLYFDVPVEEYRTFVATSSKGEYLNHVFKPKGYYYSGPYIRDRAA